MSLVIGVPRGTFFRVTKFITFHEVLQKLNKQGYGYAIRLESGAGNMSNISDDEYRATGAEIVNKKEMYEPRVTSASSCVLRGSNEQEIGLLKSNSIRRNCTNCSRSTRLRQPASKSNVR